MKTYKPSKRPLILIYILLILLLLVIKFALNFVNKFISIPNNYILLPIWIITALFAVLVLPFYFHKAFFTVTSKEITATGGLIITSKHFMATQSVKSVTLIITPLSKFTGLNFIFLNTLGARLILPFLSKKDALEISSVIDNAIRNRKND